MSKHDKKACGKAIAADGSEEFLCRPTFFLGQSPSRSISVQSETTVHEHRAPTDESVRILKELENAAIDKIVARITTGPNSLDARWIVIEETYGFCRRFICKYTLNGTDHRFDTRRDLMNGQRIEDLLKGVFEEFAADFAKHFIPSLTETVSVSKKGGLLA